MKWHSIVKRDKARGHEENSVLSSINVFPLWMILYRDK